MEEEGVGQQAAEAQTQESPPAQPVEFGNKERLDQRKEEIFKKVKEGSDKEGSFIYGLAKDSLTNDSETQSNDARRYKKLEDLRDRIEEPGVANEAIEELKIFYAQTGIEPRQTAVEVDPDTPREQKLDLVRNRIKEHIDALPEAYADHRIETYCEARAEVDDTRETLHEMVDRGDFGRDGFTKEGYKLARQENHLLLVSRDLIIDSDATPDQRNEHDDLRRDRLTDKELDSEGEIKEKQGNEYGEDPQIETLEEDDIKQRLEKVEQEYKDRLSESGDEELVQGFARMEEGVRKETIRNFAQHDYHEELLVKRLESAIDSNDSERISDLADDINKNRTVRFNQESGLNISIGQSITERTADAWDDFRNEIAIRIAGSEDPTGVISGTGQVIRGSADVLTSRISSGVARPLQEGLRRFGKAVKEKAGSVQDTARNVLNQVDHTLGDAARESGRLARDGIKRVGKEVFANIVSQDAYDDILRNRRTASTADRIFTRLNLGRRRMVSAIRIGATESFLVSRIATAGLVEEEVKLRMDEQREASAQNIESRREQIRSESFQKLDDLLLKRVVVEKQDEVSQEELNAEEKLKTPEMIEINETFGEVMGSADYSKVVSVVDKWWGTDWNRYVEYEKDGEPKSEYLQKQFSVDADLLYFSRDGKLYLTSAKSDEDEVVGFASLVGEINEGDNIDDVITQDIENSPTLEFKKEPVVIKEKELVRIGRLKYLFTWDEDGNVRGDPINEEGNPSRSPISFRAEEKIEDTDDWKKVVEDRIKKMNSVSVGGVVETDKWEVERNLSIKNGEAQEEPKITISEDEVSKKKDWTPLSEEDQKRAEALIKKGGEGIPGDEEANTMDTPLSPEEVDLLETPREELEALIEEAVEAQQATPEDQQIFIGYYLDGKSAEQLGLKGDAEEKLWSIYRKVYNAKFGRYPVREKPKLQPKSTEPVVATEPPPLEPQPEAPTEVSKEEIPLEEQEEEIPEEEQELSKNIEAARSDVENSLEEINKAKGNLSPSRLYENLLESGALKYEEKLIAYNTFLTEKHPPQEQAEADTLEAQYTLRNNETMMLYSDLKKVEDTVERFKLLKQYEDILKQKIKVYRQLTK